jgi:hypothetical protein
MIHLIIGLLSFISVLIVWMLFVPVHLWINTDLNRYEFSQPGILTISLQPGKIPFYKIKILGLKIQTSDHAKVSTAKPNEKKGRAGIKRSFKTWMFLFKGVLNSFRVKRFILNIDVGDVVLNAQLIPILLLMSRGPVSMNTNFNGRNYLDLEVEGRLNKVLWTFIRFLTKK